MKKGIKFTGGKYHKARKKRLYESGRQARIVKLDEKLRKMKIKTMGGHTKTALISTNIANVLDKKANKIQKTKIKNVLETPSNTFLARQNILVKGAIIETELGKARITNRPSQEGSVNAILIE